MTVAKVVTLLLVPAFLALFVVFFSLPFAFIAQNPEGMFLRKKKKQALELEERA